MHLLSTVTTVTGPPGTGKSCVRGPVFLIEEYLREGAGTWWGTIPVDPDKVAEAAAARVGKKGDAETIAAFRGRVRIIPADEVKKWEDGASGPWAFFKGKDLRGCHISLDEAHHYCGKKHKPAHRTRWSEWLQELRHRGNTTAEFISQNTSRLAPEIHDVAECRVTLSNTEKKWYWGFQFADLYELAAAFTRSYKPAVVVEHSRQKNERWGVERRQRIYLDPYYFQFYNSYSAPTDGSAGDGAGEVVGPVHQFERRSVPGVLFWFARRNVWVLGAYAAALCAALWLSVGGGASSMAGAYLSRVERITTREPVPHRPPTPPPAADPAPAPPTRAARVLKGERLAARLNGLVATVRRLKAELRERPPAPAFPRHPDPGMLVAVKPDAAIWADGQTLSPGNPLHGGPFDGFKLLSVPPPLNAAILRGPDNVLVRLPVAVPRRIAPVPDGLFTGPRPGTPGPVRTADLVRPAGDALGPGDAGGGLGGRPRPGDGPVRRPRAGSLRPDGDGGDRGGTPRPGGGVGGPAPGDDADGDGWRVVPRRSEADRRGDADRPPARLGAPRGGRPPRPVPDRNGGSEARPLRRGGA